MGKDLKGKELGVGISQRKDGLYTARYTDRRGNRRQKYFKKLQQFFKSFSVKVRRMTSNEKRTS